MDKYLKVRIDYLDNGEQNIDEKESKIKEIFKKNEIEKLKKQVIDIDEYRSEKLSQLNNIILEEKLENRISKLVELNLEVKEAYILQILLDLAFKINLNQKFYKYLNKVEIDNLLTAIYDKYENAPYLHMWDTSRKIRNDEEKLKFFENNLDAEIFYFYRKDKNNSNIKEFLSDFMNNLT